MKKVIKWLALGLCCTAAVMTIAGGIKDKVDKVDDGAETAQVTVVDM